MIFFSFSMGMYALNLIRKKILLEKNVFQTFIFLVNIGLLIPIVYDYLFTHINSITSAADLVTLHPAGIFGGLMHFLMHRVALLQPIFFIFFVADLFSYIKGKWALAAGGIVTMIMLMSLVIKTDGLFYENIQSELRPDFYNVTNRDNQFTLLSDWRLITDENMWNESIFKALSYLKLVTDTNTTILLLDKRNWTEETIANWGSVLLRNKISIPKEKGIGEDWKTDMNVNYSRIVKSNYQYTLFINKIDEENKNAPQPELGERVFSESNVMLFKIH